jgi:hypothetical protein
MSTHKINRILSCVNVIDEAPLNQFYYILHEGKTVFICYKHTDLLDKESNSISVRPDPLVFPLCDIYYLESLGILSAYIISVSGYDVDLFNFYLRIRRPSTLKNKFFSGAKMLLQDKYLNVFHSDEGGCLVSVNGLKRVIKPDMVRRSEKNDRESNVPAKAEEY